MYFVFIGNVSADAHPVHLHLVHFEVVSRHEIIYDTGLPGSAIGDGIYVTEQRIVQHNGKLGTGKKIVYPSRCLSPNSSPSSCYNSTALAQELRYVETGPLVSIETTTSMNASLMNCKIFS
jgi:hypothetical protein